MIKIQNWEDSKIRYSMIRDYRNCSGIYFLKSTLDNRFYIGSSQNIGSRLKSHFSNLKCNKHDNKRLQNFILKYNLSALIIYIYPISISRNKLYELENDLIDYYNTCDQGFNLSNRLGSITFDEQQRSVISERMRKQNLGRKHTKEHKQKVGKAKSVQNTGINNPRAKLTEQNIREIRMLHQNGYSNKVIQNKYNIKSASTIWSIIHNKLWKHVI